MSVERPRRFYLITDKTIEAFLGALQDPPTVGLVVNDLEDMLKRPGMSEDDLRGLRRFMVRMRREQGR